MNGKKLVENLRKDPWFAALVASEAILVIFGLFLPLAHSPSHRPTPVGLLLALTAFRLFFLSGLTLQKPGFHFPYILGACFFFLFTFGALREVYLAAAGYHPYAMNSYRWLLIFAWITRISGISWYLKRGRHIETEEPEGLFSGLATALIAVIFLCMLTPLALSLYVFDGIIYGVHIESM